MKKFVLLGVLFLIAIMIFGLGFLGMVPSTPPIKDAEGNVLPGSISELKQVELGGMKQWITIRGVDKSNPVLLWLHGGPGVTQMPLAHELDEELEEEFVVVHWDQRGAGKSNPGDFDEETMTFDRFKKDAYELTQYLKENLEREKIFLLGHSWGTHLGIELVNKYPEAYHAYIGVSQVVDSEEDKKIAYEWLLKEIEDSENQKDLEKLQDLGEGPYDTYDQYIEFVELINEYGGNFDMNMRDLFFIVTGAPEYNFMDYIRGYEGVIRGGRPLYEAREFDSIDFRQKVNSVEVPVYFFSGRDDYVTPLELVKKYYEIIEAPEKDLVVFENSAHTPFLEDTEKFNEEVIRVKQETLNYTSK